MPEQLIPLFLLRPHPNNPRKTIDPDYISELAQSFKDHGQWTPILIRPLPNGKYQIIAGHCRWEAAKAAGWTDIRADVREMSDEDADFYALDTNLKRKGLSEMEEAEAIGRMITVHGWNQVRVAERFGKTQLPSVATATCSGG
ncbi:MAG TPA: ParB/RepB/Spo0J family partition protein [Symbiobacteriaceae bacterium]|nr:ParB/RepB/Spo0J family partition protein [Symbiobacteriaceae bacterium]